MYKALSHFTRFSIATVLIASMTQTHAEQSHHDLFKPGQLPKQGSIIDFTAEDLCSVATETRNYLSLGKTYDERANHAGIFQDMGISVYRVKKTLDFICKVALEDAQAQRSNRLQDMAFLQQHFDVIRWSADKAQTQPLEDQKTLLRNLPADKILLTKYYIKKAQGSLVATDDKPFALYALPFDEAELSLDEAEASHKSKPLTRFQYTKQDILTGVLEQKKLAKPLVYLSRKDLEDTLMQGTVLVETTHEGKTTKTFLNVHRNNGHSYDVRLKKEQQKRYWYFKQTDGVKGYGKDANHKITIQPKLTVAGNLPLLGLGKLLLLSTQADKDQQQHRLVVLADTGGAFEDNRYQLDLLAGFYHDWHDYIAAWKDSDNYSEVRFLILKE